MRRLLLLTAAVLAIAAPARAVNPDEQLPDPAQEARARALSRDLRCVVCQNQSIDESDAALAHDLRIILRERIAAGDSDDQAVDFLVQRYGSFVRLKPPFQADTWALWLGPLAVLLGGGAAAAFYLRGRSGAAPETLSAAEEAELAALMKKDDAV
jgi:cytochrome c-type biogenesis protein CcmH